MGILNITPDSFSDGGTLTSEKQIIEQALKMVRAGADILDIGGESTRPFSEPVSPEEERKRVIPVIKSIRLHLPSIPISIDTTKARVAREAIVAGANIINDISALRFDPDMIGVAVEAECPVIIMHMKGTPGDMQVDPVYDDVIQEIISFLQERIAWACSKGLSKELLVVDPGIGFGKTVEHNLRILNHLAEFKVLGCPILVGHSRKSFIGKIVNREVHDRDVATAALSSMCVVNGVSILRVHDVDKTVQAVRMTEALLASS